MLGFIDGWRSEEPVSNQEDTTLLEVLPPNGRGLNLLGGEVRLVEISAAEMAFAVPQEIALKFVEGAVFQVHYKEGGASHRISGTIRKLAPGEGHLLYALSFDAIENENAHLEAVESLRRYC